jgi:hypothetical protein
MAVNQNNIVLSMFFYNCPPLAMAKFLLGLSWPTTKQVQNALSVMQHLNYGGKNQYHTLWGESSLFALSFLCLPASFHRSNNIQDFCGTVTTTVWV